MARAQLLAEKPRFKGLLYRKSSLGLPRVEVTNPHPGFAWLMVHTVSELITALPCGCLSYQSENGSLEIRITGDKGVFYFPSLGTVHLKQLASTKCLLAGWSWARYRGIEGQRNGAGSALTHFKRYAPAM